MMVIIPFKTMFKILLYWRYNLNIQHYREFIKLYCHTQQADRIHKISKNNLLLNNL